MSVGEPIPMFDYRPGHEAIEADLLAAIVGVLRSGTLILGPCVREFERAFTAFLNEPGEAVGVGNGTDAIAVALKSLEIGQGDEVIVPPNTAIPTVSAIRSAGATPAFCDIDPTTCLIDLERIESHITQHTKAIVPVHLYGNALPMAPLLAIAARHGLRVVEDCAQSCGTRWQGQQTGTFGDIGCFSFYPTKNLGACGDGGMCFTRDGNLAESMRRIRAYGCGTTYVAQQEGINSRLDELQAAILSVKLPHLPAALDRRRAIAARYDEYIGGASSRVRTSTHTEHSFHLYVILVERREELIASLKAEGIGFGVHYPVPIHRMPAYQFLGFAEGDFPKSEWAAKRVLSLPCYPGLSDAAIERVAAAIRRHAS